MEIKLGPVLYIGDCEADIWRFKVAVLTDVVEAQGPGLSLRFGENADRVEQSAPREVDTFSAVGDGLCYWMWEVEVERDPDDELWLSYRLEPDGERDVERAPHDDLSFEGVCVPRQGALPNIAFFSCNGVSEEKLYHQIPEPQRLWTEMRNVHEGLHAQEDRRAYSLLIGGGDQVYADELWNDDPLKKVRQLDHEDRKRLDPDQLESTDDLAADLTEQFVELYAHHWRRREMRDLFARIPGLYTWDDHEIMDGWGSRPRRLLTSDPYRAVYRVARRCFRVFQLGGKEGNHCVGSGHFLQRLVFDEPDHELTVVVPDLRGDRTRESVLSDDHWDDLNEEVLETHQERADEGKRRHLLFVSSIPLVHLRFPVAELAGGALSLAGLQDDLIDQWEHSNHRGERQRLIMRLLEAARKGGSRVTVLSGDVHVGARGRIVSTDPRHLPTHHDEGNEGSAARSESVIHQVTASGIGHPPPSVWEWTGMRAVADESESQDGEHVVSKMAPITSDRDYLRARNWLSVQFDGPDQAERRDETRLWCKWFYEEGDLVEGGTRVRGLSEEVVVPAR